jgi:hypothetical protein
MKCPTRNESLRNESLICKKVHFEEYTVFTVTEDYLIIPKTLWREEIKISRAEKRYCLGPNYNSDSFNNPLGMKLFFCPIPCKGETPCIRLVIQY